MKTSGAVTKWLFILTLPALLISATIAVEFNRHGLYNRGYQKYGVSQTTGLSQTELEKVTTELINYFNSNEEYLSLTIIKDSQPFKLFNQREIAHMKDVKRLVRMDYHLLLGTAIYIGAYAGICLLWRRRRYWRRLVWGVAIGSSLALGVIVAMGLASTVMDFDQLFLKFHHLAFTNQLWMLDPTKDYLIMLFPEDFWYDATMLFAKITIGVSATLCGLSWGYLRLSKRQSKN